MLSRTLRRLRKPKKQRESASKGRRRSRPQPENDGAPSFVAADPLGDLSPEERERPVIELGQKAEEAFAGALTNLASSLPKSDPCVLLAAVAEKVIAEPPSPEAIRENPEKLLQHHLELLQAFCLRLDLRQYEPGIDPLAFYDELLLELHTIANAAVLQGLRHLDASDTNRHQTAARQLVQLATFAIRNFGYEPQIRRLCDDLLAPFADSLYRSTGVRPGSLVALIDGIIRTTQIRADGFTSKFNLMLQAKSIPDAVTAYLSAFPQITCPADKLSAYIDKVGVTLEQIKSIFSAHLRFVMPSIFMFTTEDLADLLTGPDSGPAVELAVRTWSLAFGDLSGCNPEDLILSNPVWTQPMIQLSDETVFIPCPEIIHGKRILLLEKALLRDPRMRERYQKHRGSYLEKRTAELLEQQLAGASIWRGALWRDPATGTQYENDILLRIDTHMFIVEAKSGHITDAARRGAPDRLKRTVRKIVQEPSEQASRFEDFLRTNDGQIKLSNRKGDVYRIDLAGVRHFVKLNVTLDMIGDLLSRWPRLREAGWLPEDFRGCPTVPLWDLETITTMLEGPCQAIHYWRRRSELEAEIEYRGDEIDLLGLYLQSGFNHPALHDDTRKLLITTQDLIDPFMMQESLGLQVEKPRLQLTEWWRRILERLETLRVPGWSDLGYCLLNVDYNDQKFFEARFRRIQRDFRCKALSALQRNTVVLEAGPKNQRIALAVVFYKGIDRAERDRSIKRAASAAFGRSAAGQAVLIARSLDRSEEELPYSVLALCRRQSGSSTGSTLSGDARDA